VTSFRILMATWLAAGCGAVLGSMAGAAVSRTGLFVGAAIGGLAGIAAAAALLAAIGWLPRADTRAAFIGGAGGFAVATPIAVFNLHTPVTPVLSCALVGVGALLGIGVARGWRAGSGVPPDTRPH
jgi:hypothetical protein